MTIDATSQRKNIVTTIALGGTDRSRTLRWMITPARLRNVTLWYSANKRQMTLKTTKAGELWGAYPLAPALARWIRRIEALPGYERTYPPHWHEG